MLDGRREERKGIRDAGSREEAFGHAGTVLPGRAVAVQAGPRSHRAPRAPGGGVPQNGTGAPDSAAEVFGRAFAASVELESLVLVRIVL